MSQALQTRIRAAFEARACPDDGLIGRERPGCTGHEGNLVAEFFAGRDWHSLSYDDIADEGEGYEGPLSAIFSFMQPEGFAYFLPAFLLIALESGADAHKATFIDSLCYHLVPPDPEMLEKQYDLVKDRADVPDDIKASLKHPTPEARASVATLVADFQRLQAMFTSGQRSVIRDVLSRLATDARSEGVADEFNDAHCALPAWQD